MEIIKIPKSKKMKDHNKNIAFLIKGMKKKYKQKKNMMKWASLNSKVDDIKLNTLIAYDLQAGTYVNFAKKKPKFNKLWTDQMANLLNPLISNGDRILEAGVGEGTTLKGVLNSIELGNLFAYGFDLSWSRVSIAKKWMKEKKEVNLFVADLLKIPFADNSIDVVYTSHSLEPNKGQERNALAELLRISRKAVVLVEPCYELASKSAKKRMRFNNYVQGLKTTAESLGAKIKEYRLLEICSNPLNPSCVISLEKQQKKPIPDRLKNENIWQCPLTGEPLSRFKKFFYVKKMGIAYPIFLNVPLLRPEHAVVASKIC